MEKDLKENIYMYNIYIHIYTYEWICCKTTGSTDSSRRKKYLVIYWLFTYSFKIFLFSSRFAWAFSICSKRGLLSSWGTWASHCSGFSACGAQALECVSLAAPRHVGSSRTGDRTCVPCTGRWILNQRAIRKAQFRDLASVDPGWHLHSLSGRKEL